MSSITLLTLCVVRRTKWTRCKGTDFLRNDQIFCEKNYIRVTKPQIVVAAGAEKNGDTHGFPVAEKREIFLPPKFQVGRR